MQSLHRYRSWLVGNPTQLINQARAFLLERGIALPQGKQRFAVRLPEILEDADNGLPDQMRALLADMLAEWEALQAKIDELNRWLLREAQASEACVRLREIPGIGAQTATALVAAIGDGQAFEQGRGLAGLGAEGVLDGGQAAPRRHQQAGQPLPPYAAGALCALGPGDPVEAHRSTGDVAAAPARKQRPAGSDRRAGGAAGTDRLGLAEPWPALLSTGATSPGGLTAIRPAAAQRAAHSSSANSGLMDKTVVPASPNPVTVNGPERSM